MSKAVEYSEYGGPEVLQLVEETVGEPGEGQLRVTVRAAGLNPFDYKVRRGGYIPNHTLPARQGAEFAGVVDAIGDGVTGFAVGDAVVGWLSSGAQAAQVLVPAKQLTLKPDAVSFEAAAGVGLVANTARRAVDSLGLEGGETVLVSGVSGPVGLISAQFARRQGARVIGTASPAHHDELRVLGIEPVAYGEGELERLRAASERYDAMLDNIGGEAIRIGLALGIPAARINTVADKPLAAEVGAAIVGGGGKTAEELAGFLDELAAGTLVLPVRASFPAEQVQDAFRELETGRGSGKVVLTF